MSEVTHEQAAEARDAMFTTLVRFENENERLHDALDLMAMLVVRYERLHTLMASLEQPAYSADVDAAGELAAEADEAMYDNELARAAYERAKKATKPVAGKE